MIVFCKKINRYDKRSVRFVFQMTQIFCFCKTYFVLKIQFYCKKYVQLFFISRKSKIWQLFLDYQVLTINIVGYHFGFVLCKCFKKAHILLCLFMAFKVRCHTIGVRMYSFRLIPKNPSLRVGEGGSETPNYVQNALDYLNDVCQTLLYQQRFINRSDSFINRLIKLMAGGDSYGTLCPINKRNKLYGRKSLDKADSIYRVLMIGKKSSHNFKILFFMNLKLQQF